MPLKNIKQNAWIGIDYATKSDITVISMPCGNCGTYRTLTGVILEKCWECGDDEMDLSMPTIYDQEENADEKINHQTTDPNPALKAVSPILRSRNYKAE